MTAIYVKDTFTILKKKSIILLLLGQLKFREDGHVEVTAKLATGLRGMPGISLPDTLERFRLLRMGMQLPSAGG